MRDDSTQTRTAWHGTKRTHVALDNNLFREWLENALCSRLWKLLLKGVWYRRTFPNADEKSHGFASLEQVDALRAVHITRDHKAEK